MSLRYWLNLDFGRLQTFGSVGNCFFLFFCKQSSTISNFEFFIASLGSIWAFTGQPRDKFYFGRKASNYAEFSRAVLEGYFLHWNFIKIECKNGWNFLLIGVRRLSRELFLGVHWCLGYFVVFKFVFIIFQEVPRVLRWLFFCLIYENNI